jgi:hypothetical protein
MTEPIAAHIVFFAIAAVWFAGIGYIIWRIATDPIPARRPRKARP